MVGEEATDIKVEFNDKMKGEKNIRVPYQCMISFVFEMPKLT